MLAAQQAQPRDYNATAPGGACGFLGGLDSRMERCGKPCLSAFLTASASPCFAQALMGMLTGALLQAPHDPLRYYLLNEKKRRLMERLQRIPGVRRPLCVKCK